MLSNQLSPRAIALATTLLCCTCASSSALAQDTSQAPFRVDIVDVSKSKKKSAKAARVLEDRFENAEEFDLEVGSFMKGTPEHGVEELDLRTAKERAANREQIADAIQASGLDALVLIDAYDRGRKLQMIVLDPSGDNIHESRTRLKRAATLSDNEAQRLFRQALAEALPILSKRRAQRQQKRGRRAHTKHMARGRTTSTKSARQVKVRGLRSGRLVVDGGVHVGKRTLDSRSALQGSMGLRQSAWLVGPSVRVAGGKALEHHKLHLGGDVDFAWAPFKLSYIEVGDAEPTTLGANFLRLDAIGRVTRGLHDQIALGLQLGVGFHRTSVDTNVFYNGNSYLWGRIGVELILSVMSGSSLTLTASALPVMNAKISDAGFGESERALGYELGAELRIGLTEELDFTARFRRSRVDVNYLSTASDTTPTTADTLNAGTVGLGYSF